MTEEELDDMIYQIRKQVSFNIADIERRATADLHTYFNEVIRSIDKILDTYEDNK